MGSQQQKQISSNRLKSVPKAPEADPLILGA